MARGPVTDHEVWFKMEMAQRIRVARRGARITQKDLAVRVGVCRATISNLESGQFSTSPYLLFTISQQLGVEVGDLFPPIGAVV